MDQQTAGMIAGFVLLGVSEILPFVKNVQANGILQQIVIILKSGIKPSRTIDQQLSQVIVDTKTNEKEELLKIIKEQIDTKNVVVDYTKYSPDVIASLTDLGYTITHTTDNKVMISW
jgi:hypothetical protein